MRQACRIFAIKMTHIYQCINKLFFVQTTRRIIAAIHQQITFNEFFPVLLGEVNMKRFGLTLTKEVGLLKRESLITLRATSLVYRANLRLYM